ncbi:MAG: hypothetical protein F6J90_01260 [Moorea sp. SIOASIH]|uniref:hypothetical protein n=1 Tax=Moorena sp. SIOASIH TaxID=2607817 RepID=UPI0013BCE66C|nr:hypothetical protein [Moorena sp. SIOASIH]NEO35003.1 hypothetical protein [Moorena sp. SIOASIH]
MLNYREKINPWIIVLLQPKLSNITVGRFRRRGNAEEHLRVLKQMMPEAKFSIMFDVETIREDVVN